jgi:hypothetical protein
MGFIVNILDQPDNWYSPGNYSLITINYKRIVPEKGTGILSEINPIFLIFEIS